MDSRGVAAAGRFPAAGGGLWPLSFANRCPLVLLLPGHRVPVLPLIGILGSSCPHTAQFQLGIHLCWGCKAMGARAFVTLLAGFTQVGVSGLLLPARSWSWQQQGFIPGLAWHPEALLLVLLCPASCGHVAGWVLSAVTPSVPQEATSGLSLVQVVAAVLGALTPVLARPRGFWLHAWH